MARVEPGEAEMGGSFARVQNGLNHVLDRPYMQIDLHSSRDL